MPVLATLTRRLTAADVATDPVTDATSVPSWIQAAMAATPAYPSKTRRKILKLVFEDTKRELRYLGLTDAEIAQVKPPSVDDEVVDKILAALGITGPGQEVPIDNQRLQNTMRLVHSDTNRALIALGRDPKIFKEPQVYCHENQQFKTVAAIAKAAGCTTTRAYEYR